MTSRIAHRSPVSRIQPLALLLIAALLLPAAACSSIPGLERALSNSFGGGFFGLAGPAAPTDADAGAAEDAARAIEEADVVKLVGDIVYVLNRFRGLVIIDASDADAPHIVGMLESLRGRGVEMYVVGQQAYVLLSADYFYPYYGEGGVGIATNARFLPPDDSLPPPPDFEGSQLAIVNVADPANPVLKDKLNLAGFANESRRVGDVIYVVGANFPFFYLDDEANGDDGSTDASPSSTPVLHEGFVASVNVADPDNIIPVERKSFEGNSLDIHVSQTRILAASQNYDFSSGQAITNVQLIDISDPAGAIALRGSVNVPGYIRNRFYLDDFADVLRIVTESWGFGFRTVTLYTYDLADPDNIAPLGNVEVIRGESLEAVRFDGPRGYVVTFERIDPLFVIDLRDPASPVVTGVLEVPGFSTHIEPRGDRLIAVGIDDTDGRRPAVAYYDVSDPENPAELGRVILGPPGSFTESEATYDEKAFKIVDELGFIAIPFRHVEFPDVPPMPGPLPGFGAREGLYPEPTCMNAVQIVDFSDTALTQRGWFEHRGRVERVGVVGDRVFALSQISFRTVNIEDRDNPQPAGVANFFPEDAIPPWADDCAYYGPIDFPPGPGGPLDGLPVIIQIFVDGELCGTISALPAAMLIPGLWLIRQRSTPRRRRR